jgi:hypothetical protein
MEHTISFNVKVWPFVKHPKSDRENLKQMHNKFDKYSQHKCQSKERSEVRREYKRVYYEIGE